MAITKARKSEIFADVSKAVKGSQSVVFVNFHGVPVSDQTVMRKKLRSEGVGYMVAKKSIAKKAFADAGVTGTVPELGGELAIAYSPDLIAPAREVFDFQKKFDKKLSILGGIFEGKFMNKVEMMEIALIPGVKTLQAQFVQLINSPVSGFVRALDAIAKSKTV